MNQQDKTRISAKTPADFRRLLDAYSRELAKSGWQKEEIRQSSKSRQGRWGSTWSNGEPGAGFAACLEEARPRAAALLA